MSRCEILVTADRSARSTSRLSAYPIASPSERRTNSNENGVRTVVSEPHPSGDTLSDRKHFFIAKWVRRSRIASSNALSNLDRSFLDRLQPGLVVAATPVAHGSIRPEAQPIEGLDVATFASDFGFFPTWRSRQLDVSG